ncbi:MAG: FAD-dependent oxidoreductase [Alphaproteobacteria bacterium]|nr:FAD-dependent oxidoreductase [Alphaproteobacteria bacterium]
MPSPFPHLSAPIRLGHLDLPHRIVFGAQTTNMAEERQIGDDRCGYFPGPQYRAFYAARARGGAALIVTEPVAAHPTSRNTRAMLDDSDAIVSDLRAMTDECHRLGAAMIQQIAHVGANADADNAYLPGWSPSGLVSLRDFHGSHAMTPGEIRAVIDGFARVARRARAAGFDGVEIHAAHAGLIEQFWSPLTNQRADEWGGSDDNRLRFSIAVLEAVRAAAGTGFIVGLSITGDDEPQGGLVAADRLTILSTIDSRRLADYVVVKTGSAYAGARLAPPFLMDGASGASLAQRFRPALKNALLIAEGGIRDVAEAERIVAAGKADLVSIVRGQIADPALASKALTGRAAEVRPCLACNQWCEGRRARDYWISCVVNPTTGREHEWNQGESQPATQPRRVLVVGAGPGGLEAARVLAQRGHRVILAERSQAIGGQLRRAAAQPRRDAVGDLLEWYRGELMRYQVEMRMGAEMGVTAVREIGADVVVLATGSRPARDGFQRALPHVDRLPGVDAPDVFAVDDVLDGTAAPGTRVLLVDDTGGWAAAGTGLLLAERGHAVSILCSHPVIARHLVATRAHGPLRAALRRLKVEEILNAALVEWRAGAAQIQDTLSGRVAERAFDTLVLATTNVAEAGLAGSLAEAGIAAHAIGDCVSPRNMGMAIFEARKLAMTL